MYKEEIEQQEYPWIWNNKFKPDCNDCMLTEDFDGSYTVGRFQYGRAWFDRDGIPISVRRWMEIPPMEEE